MLKNLFKAAKSALKNPLVQMGIGAFLPGMLPASLGVLRNPAIVQAGLGLLGGDKPENVVKNLGIQALLGGGSNLLQGGTFQEGVKRQFTTPKNIYDYDESTGRNIKTVTKNPIQEVIEKATAGTLGGGTGNDNGGIFGLSPDNLIDLASIAVPFVAAAQAKDAQQQINPQNLGVNLDAYKAAMGDSPYQSMAAAGGIQGFKKGGADPTNGMNKVSYGSTMGEPNGLFTGPGGPKEDKIDVMLSPGEFVVTAEATKKIGVDNLYDMMNKVDPDSEKPEEYRERVGMA